MTQLNKHPLLMQVYDLCRQIETLGASPELTVAVSMAGDLMKPIETLVGELDKLKSEQTLNQLLNMVCGSLPEDYNLTLTMENGAAWVEAYDYQGFGVQLPEQEDATMATQLCQAVNYLNGLGE